MRFINSIIILFLFITISCNNSHKQRENNQYNDSLKLQQKIEDTDSVIYDDKLCYKVKIRNSFSVVTYDSAEYDYSKILICNKNNIVYEIDSVLSVENVSSTENYLTLLLTKSQNEGDFSTSGNLLIFNKKNNRVINNIYVENSFASIIKDNCCYYTSRDTLYQINLDSKSLSILKIFDNEFFFTLNMKLRDSMLYVDYYNDYTDDFMEQRHSLVDTISIVDH